MTTVAERAKAWGPLATPVHTDVEPVDADGTSWWTRANPAGPAFPRPSATAPSR